MSDSTGESTLEPKRGLNYKVLLLIAALAVIYQTFNYILPETEGELSPIDIVFTISIATCAGLVHCFKKIWPIGGVWAGLPRVGNCVHSVCDW